VLLSIAGGLQTDYPEVILRTSWKVSFSVTSPMSREPGAGQVTGKPRFTGNTDREFCMEAVVIRVRQRHRLLAVNLKCTRSLRSFADWTKNRTLFVFVGIFTLAESRVFAMASFTASSISEVIVRDFRLQTRTSPLLSRLAVINIRSALLLPLPANFPVKVFGLQHQGKICSLRVCVQYKGFDGQMRLRLQCLRENQSREAKSGEQKTIRDHTRPPALFYSAFPYGLTRAVAELSGQARFCRWWPCGHVRNCPRVRANQN